MPRRNRLSRTEEKCLSWRFVFRKAFVQRLLLPEFYFDRKSMCNRLKDQENAG